MMGVLAGVVGWWRLGSAPGFWASRCCAGFLGWLVMSGRGSDPRRERGPVFGVRRQELMSECLSFLADIGEVDGQLGELAGRRRSLVKELQSRRVLLMPVLSRGGGRAPVGDGLVCLPPVDLEAPALWGRRLRASCVALLGGAGELSLSELHVLLHLSGFQSIAPRR